MSHIEDLTFLKGVLYFIWILIAPQQGKKPHQTRDKIVSCFEMNVHRSLNINVRFNLGLASGSFSPLTLGLVSAI